MSQVDDAELSGTFQRKQKQKAVDAKENASFADFLLGKVQTTFTIDIQDGLSIEFREPTNNDKVRLMRIGSIGSRLYQESRVGMDEGNLDEVDRMLGMAEQTLYEIDLFLESMTIDGRLTAENFYSKLPATAKEIVLTGIKSRAGLQAESALKTRKK